MDTSCSVDRFDPDTGKENTPEDPQEVNVSCLPIPEELEEAIKLPLNQNYRTQAKAGGDIVKNYPERMVIPTLMGWQNAVSLYPNGNAYLQPVSSLDGLKFERGKLFFEGALQPLSEVELENIITKEGIENIDLPLLRIYYSIILTRFDDAIKQGKTSLDSVITLFVPDLAECLGLQRNINKKDIQIIVKKTQTFHNILGVLHITRNCSDDTSYFPVLNFEGYDAERNTIAFSSPYLNYIVRKIYDISIIMDKKGEPKLKKSGELLKKVSHSYLIKSELAKEKNKAAADNVVIIVALIEQAGNHTPKIKASTIIERNPALKQRLEYNAKPARLLERVFKKTWELLRTQTYLQQTYENIKLPDPENIQNIPNMKDLDKFIFEFPHEGKKPSHPVETGPS